MKPPRKISGITALILSLASCVLGINSGKIVEMTHEPERRYLVDKGYDTTIYEGDPEDGSDDVKIHTAIWKTMVDDEDWVIEFEKEVEGRIGKRTFTTIQRRRIYATEKFYNPFQVGDNIDISNYVENPIPFENSDPDFQAD